MSNLYIKRSFRQDRLGTNIGKVEKKGRLPCAPCYTRRKPNICQDRLGTSIGKSTQKRDHRFVTVANLRRVCVALHPWRWRWRWRWRDAGPRYARGGYVIGSAGSDDDGRWWRRWRPQQRERERWRRLVSFKVRKQYFFATVCTPKMIICQDRLGTNIGKALQKEYRFLAQRFFGE